MGNTYRLRWVEQGYVSLLNHPKWLLFVVAGFLVVAAQNTYIGASIGAARRYSNTSSRNSFAAGSSL